jgi:dTDP-4-amino-4,6-dideoxygalactose transaminase
VQDNFIPFGRPAMGEAEITELARVVRSGWIGMGPETQAFERDLAPVLGAEHVVAVSSCTGALFLALTVHGIGPGDEVICPSLTWCSSANVALYRGARPVFCDIDPDTLSMTTDTVLAKVTPRTRAVVVVHYGGRAVDVEALRARLPARIAIIEDAAHALGATRPDGRPVGSGPNLVCFSFYANKNLSTGEGGAIAVTDPAVADHLLSLRLHALPTDAWQRHISRAMVRQSFNLTELGYKLNYTDLQAAIGRVQLRRQPEFAAIRHRIAEHYVDALSRSRPDIRFQADILERGHARHLFVILLPPGTTRLQRDRIVTDLRNEGIGASIHYAPLHLMPLYEPATPLPVVEDVGERILTLPISASMTMADAARITAAANTVIGSTLDGGNQ